MSYPSLIEAVAVTPMASRVDTAAIRIASATCQEYS
jgi:hypothetical protein